MPDALRADFSRLEIVHTDAMQWAPSPSPTVWRKRLERSGPAEAGRVTSVVRYDPGSHFHPHPHPDGEEIFVISGVFEDHRGAHPAGSYLLAAEGFEHAPRSGPGCMLFVKLRQYPGTDRRTLSVDSGAMPWSPHPTYAGVEVKTLYTSAAHPEKVRLVRLAAGVALEPVELPGGGEIFVLEGRFTDANGDCRPGSWMRIPAGGCYAPRSEHGCVFYMKRDHLTGR